ncbi:hypothetical protein [Mesorhizobium cantuariense]|uniref:Uncharacterized protein n=1 Tax=Mesorhizobium cantuariense TaxID=1300275 RepID=A0ABV7MTN5_9HYPH
MTEIPDAHKTDSQKTWAFRDRKCREVEEKRKLQSLAHFLAGWLALPIFQRLALAISARNRSTSG